MTLKTSSRLGFAAALLLTAGAAIATLSPLHTASAESMNHAAMQANVGDITVSGAMARFVLAGRPGAVFLTIDNAGEADRLIAASSPLTGRVELHTHLIEDGVMKMRQIEAIDIAANGKTELKSGGLHIMLFGVDPLPEKGSKVPLTLTFEKAGTVDIKAMVGEPGMTHSH
ncbi:MAG: copper chaperone PCu(A)C [Anderseniella sp.]|jgi:copper(I)-binding protein|nr:copper chaperone PCu(A)C [Anderseniella sp.]